MRELKEKAGKFIETPNCGVIALQTCMLVGQSRTSIGLQPEAMQLFD